MAWKLFPDPVSYEAKVSAEEGGREQEVGDSQAADEEAMAKKKGMRIFVLVCLVCLDVASY